MVCKIFIHGCELFAQSNHTSVRIGIGNWNRQWTNAIEKLITKIIIINSMVGWFGSLQTSNHHEIESFSEYVCILRWCVHHQPSIDIYYANENSINWIDFDLCIVDLANIPKCGMRKMRFLRKNEFISYVKMIFNQIEYVAKWKSWNSHLQWAFVCAPS